MTRIARVLAAVALLLAALLGCGHGKPSSAEYVEEEVTFVADGLTIHGTYRHPAAETPARAMPPTPELIPAAPAWPVISA